MEEKKSNPEGIELRSEKVRNIIGDRPSLLLRWGTAIIALLFALIIGVVLMLPYPYGSGESIFRHIFS